MPGRAIVGGMFRRWWLALILLAGAAGGYLAFQRHQNVQQVGQVVYQELDGNGYAPLPGILEDPVFQDLPPPPPEKPRSLGRYKPPAQAEVPEPEPPPPEPVQADPAPEAPEEVAPEAPVPAVSEEPAAETPSPPNPPTPQPPAASPQAPSPAPAQIAPERFLDRIRTRATIHVLVMGNDQPELGTGRADVLLVLSMDPVKRQLTFLSIPRDTRTLIPDFQVEKINAGYAHGGATRQTLAVEHFLGIPMDKYVEISMNGFQRAIDLVGGVTVNPPFEFSLDQYHFKPGTVRLNGEQALAYSRMRKQDPKGDLGRNDRQREIIRSLMKSLGELSPTEFNDLLVKLQRDLRTDFSPSEVVELRRIHDYLLTNQVTESVRGVNRKLGGVWYFQVSDQERRRLHLRLR